ncbi:MAG: hypothetical protein M3O20_11395 [Acidobacteriota bacterium]|nr:hypothetical protein [Acidobacteriota bacterium]
MDEFLKPPVSKKAGIISTAPVIVAPKGLPTPRPPNKAMAVPRLKNDFFLFKASPLFTEGRKVRIVDDVVRVRIYLSNLGLYLPIGILPLGVDDPHTAYGINTAVGSRDVTLSDYLFIKPESIDDHTAMTREYIHYVVTKALDAGLIYKAPAQWATYVSSAEGGARLRMDGAFTSYLNWEFWGHKTDNAFGSEPWLDSLWELRDHFGSQFTDSLVSYFIKSFAIEESPKSIGGKTFMVSGEPTPAANPATDAAIHWHLFKANRIVDNNDSRLSSINEILREHGVTVPQ